VLKLLSCSLALLVLAAPSAGLTESPRLAAIYDSILRARFDDARAQTRTACPPAPTEACLALTAVSLWWQIQLDPDNRRLDRTLETASATATRAADQWVEREPDRAEAWFYRAGARAPLTEWRILRGERLAAAREARTIKEALERALALDGTLQDAYFGIGLYHYYADVAPVAAKFLRWLLLMPGGDRAQGLREMLRARDGGVLLAGEADYQLHWLYLWYEHQPDRALALLEGLDARYPSNPLFLQRIAEVQRNDRHDQAASLAAWRMLLDRVHRGTVASAAIAESRARLGIARGLIDASHYSDALAIVTPVITSRAAVPYGALAEAELTAGRVYEQLGERERALDALDHAVAHTPSDDPRDIRSRARAATARIQSHRK
jgi:tetratricopeptide (TPR) repeat protein